MEGNSQLTLLCDVELTKEVNIFGGVMSDSGTLISNGDFVMYSDGDISVSLFYISKTTYLLLMITTLGSQPGFIADLFPSV